MTLRRLIAIAGPTASGKSRIALELAERLGGEILNADSRQVYRGMDIGTAKPSKEARQRVRHHLYDMAEPGESYSLALYLRQAKAALDEIWSRGSFAWLVGGTGQYLWALLEDWQVPEVPPDETLRAELANHAVEFGPDALHARLASVDPLAAGRIDARNVRRVIRALEVFEHTGVPISAWQKRGEPSFEYLLYGIRVEKADLHERIERRVDEMFAAGLIQEVESLLQSGVSRNAPAMSSIGYGEAVRHLEGELSPEQAIAATKLATRQLARRQGQWFREDDSRIHWVDDADSIELEANIFTGACTNVIRGSSRW